MYLAPDPLLLAVNWRGRYLETAVHQALLFTTAQRATLMRLDDLL
jgi:hypothetical protein